MTILPRAFAVRDFAGFARLTPAIQQFLALLPTHYKADVGLEQ
jgi:hypothetical protein